MKKRLRLVGTLILCLTLLNCNGVFLDATTATVTNVSQSPTVVTPTTETPTENTTEHSVFLDELAASTWTYLSSDWATSNHLPWSWRSSSISGGDYANTAEIGFYALAWLATYDLQRLWSPSWTETETEVNAILDQLRDWQTGSQVEQPHGPNAYANSVFYQWYWISWTPPVVGADAGTNHLVPSVDNAWLAVSLITIREYAEAHNHPTIGQKADAILNDMDFTLWYHPDTHLFSWGVVEDPYNGSMADFYSNENRIINFVARALGDLTPEEFRLSLEALSKPSGTYKNITVESVAWDGSYFTYLSPALFIREMDTDYGQTTLLPVTQAQIAYAQEQGYEVWGLSDCYDVGSEGYVQQGSPPTAMPDPPETRPGLVTPHAIGMALITPLTSEAITTLKTISSTFDCAYDPQYGFRDSVMTNPGDPNYGQCSDRFSALDQEWLYLALINHESGFIWDYFYRDEGVVTTHREMYGSQVYLPLVIHNSSGNVAVAPIPELALENR